MYELIPLHRLTPGQVAPVGQIVGDPVQVHRLQELGFRNGTNVEMVRAGSPCIVRLSGQKLCFRQNDNLRILVQAPAVT